MGLAEPGFQDGGEKTAPPTPTLVLPALCSFQNKACPGFLADLPVMLQSRDWTHGVQWGVGGGGVGGAVEVCWVWQRNPVGLEL